MAIFNSNPASSTPNDYNDDIDDIAPPPPPPPPSPYSPRDYPRSFLAHTTIDNCSRVASRRVASTACHKDDKVFYRTPPPVPSHVD